MAPAEAADRSRLGAAELHSLFTRIVRAQWSERIVPRTAAGRRVLFVGGQPGAGKTSVERDLRDVKGLGEGIALAIDADLFRTYHPGFRLSAVNDLEASSRTQEDVDYLVDRAVSYAISTCRNTVVNGTMGNSRKTRLRMEQFRDAGYEVHVAFVAVAEAWSRLRVVSRYVEERRRGPCAPARYVPLIYHDKAYAGLLETAADIAAIGVATDTLVCTSSARPVRVWPGAPADAAVRAITEERDRSWTPVELMDFLGSYDKAKHAVSELGLPAAVAAKLGEYLEMAMTSAQGLAAAHD